MIMDVKLVSGSSLWFQIRFQVSFSCILTVIQHDKIHSNLDVLEPDYMENFSPFCRCLAYAVKSLIKNIYDYMKKNFSPDSQVKFQPGQGRPESRLNGLKISDVIVFSLG